MSAKYTVRRVVSRDRYNALVTTREVFIDGQWVILKKRIGNVFSNVTYKDGSIGYTIGDAVFELRGESYRLGAKTCAPLKLKAGETLEAADFLAPGQSVMWKYLAK